MKRFCLLLFLSIAYIRVYAADPVVVTSDDFVRGATIAFYYGSVTPNGSVVSQRGICYADTPNPTVENNKVMASGTTFCCRLNNLKAGSRHYVRAFAITSDNRVFYGENKTFTTIPEGQVKFVVNWNTADDADKVNYNRISAATKSAVDYYNKCTSIKNVTITSNYNPGTPTADCSYGGWIRFGSNSSYQRIGTALHEMAHGIGVGTHAQWSNWGSRGWLIYDGLYKGNRANRVVKLMSKDASAIMKGDSQHFWPYGINGAHEDDNTEMLYLINCLLVQAMGEDGLPSSSSYNFATPYESFISLPHKKYYIKNEMISQGRDTKFLCANSNHQLVQLDMTPDEALRDDRAAWYIDFIPSKQLYTLRNVATNAYICFAGNNRVNGFVMKDSTAVTNQTLIQFQLFPNRNNLPVGESLRLNLSGYQIVYPNSLQQILCKAASIYSTAAQMSDDPSAARWVILDPEQVSLYEVVVGNVRDNYQPDTNAVYTIRPKNSELCVKAYATNKMYLVEYRENDNNQRWRLKPVLMPDSTLRYCFWNIGTEKCMTLLKWTGTRTSAKSASSTKMMAYDSDNLNQQLSLRTVEMDLSLETPMRYFAIENDQVIDGDSTVFRLDYYDNLTVGAQLKNCFEENGVLESQIFRLQLDSMYDAIDRPLLSWRVHCVDNRLCYQQIPPMAQLEIYNVMGQKCLSRELNDEDGEISLERGVYIVKLRSGDQVLVQKIISR